jgi:protein TonB
MWARAGLLCLLIATVTPCLIATVTTCHAETDAVDAWRRQVIMRLMASRRFPPEAIGQHGTAMVAFVLDRSGKLISNKLKQGSGAQALDAEAVAIVERAQPFPAPPPELDDDRLKWVLPVDFHGGSPISEQEAVVKAKMRSICRGC